MTTDEIGWVATSDTLERLVAALKRTSLAAVDTEFVREKTYYPQLCLIQIATRDEVACIDCLAPLDLSPLYVELFRPDFAWVLHSARQDLEVVWQRTQRMPPRLIDTQIAAALAGNAPQIGLENLLARTLGVELGESYARTDWSRRPLPPLALAYALDDVRHLRAARGRRVDGVGPLERRARAAVRGAVRGARARTLARSRRAALGPAAPLATDRRATACDRGRDAA